MNYNASSASAFVGSLGVNLHVSWSGVAPYSNTQGVMNAMNYLGVHAARDFMNGPTTGIYDTMAANGFKFDLFYNQETNLSDFITQVHNLEAAHPGSVLSVEGPNEINGMLAQATAIQKDLYTRINADPLLANKPVYAATIAGIDPNNYSQLKIDGYADNGNVHIYFNGGMPSYGLPGNSTWSFDNWLKSGTWNVPGKPVVITESGASNFPSDGSGVDDATQAKQVLDAVMDAAARGVPMTYLYELVDSQPFWTNNELNGHWGLFKSDFTPKLAATSLHNLTTIMTDGGALNGAPGSLDYTIQGAPQTGGQMLFQEGDGTKDIVVWAEPDIWNENTHTAIAAPNTPITIDLATAANVSIYDPMKGSTPVQSLGTTSHITLNVTDHPLIVEIKSATGGGSAPATGGTTTPSAGMALTTAPTGGSLTGGTGGDTLTGLDGRNTLFGGDGADSITGGSGFNRVNGNQGEDAITGQSLVGDWLLGGQGNDQIDATQSSGHNIINGNMGTDVLTGGFGGDTLRGGQGDDVIVGGSGNDWIFGDLGNDTTTGGAGADTFHAGAGVDRITDFHLSEGDRVHLNAGATYTVNQVGADTVVDLSQGDQMILANVQASSLTGGWIFAS